jgi:hypothetical protein
VGEQGSIACGMTNTAHGGSVLVNDAHGQPSASLPPIAPADDGQDD